MANGEEFACFLPSQKYQLKYFRNVSRNISKEMDLFINSTRSAFTALSIMWAVSSTLLYGNSQFSSSLVHTIEVLYFESRTSPMHVFFDMLINMRKCQ